MCCLMNGDSHLCVLFYLSRLCHRAGSVAKAPSGGCDPAVPAQLCGLSVPQVCEIVAKSVHNELQTYLRTLPGTEGLQVGLGAVLPSFSQTSGQCFTAPSQQRQITECPVWL